MQSAQDSGPEGVRTVRKPGMIRAVLTDVQFWIPVGVLVFGLGLLVWLH